MTGKRYWMIAAMGMLAACAKHRVAAVSEPAAGGAEAGKPSALAAAASSVPVTPQPAVIAVGRALRVRTTSVLSTKTAKPGERFEATLSEPVVVDGATVLPKGARVEGMVAESNPGGRVKGRAVIGVRLTGVEVQGRMVPLQTSVYRQLARGTKSHDAMKIGGGAGAGAAIGAIAGGGAGAAFGAMAGAGAGTGLVLATHGAPAVIASESVIWFQLRSAVSVPL